MLQITPFNKFNGQFGFFQGFGIRIDLMRDPDPAFFKIADPDPGLFYELNSNFIMELFKVIFFLLPLFLLS